MKRTLTMLILLALASGLSAQAQDVIQNIITPGGQTALCCHENIPEITDVNGEVFFHALQLVDYYDELWRSDGTQEGTERLGGANKIQQFTAVGGTLFFVYTNVFPEDTGLQTYPGGLVKVFPNTAVGDLTDVSGLLFFSVNEGVDGPGSISVWKSDGTETGTVLVRAIGTPKDLFQFTALDNLLFFEAVTYDGPYWPWTALARDLWVSDGTESGTRPVLDGQGRAATAPTQLTPVGQALFFAADDPDAPGMRALWKSDGTPAGTAVVQGGFPAEANFDAFAAVGTTLFFSVDNSIRGQELWRSDGTPAGTMLVKDLAPGPTGSGPVELTAVSSTLFFGADDPTGGGRALWRSDGTAPGTVVVRSGFPAEAAFGEFTDLLGVLYFVADDGVHGRELWKSNGTAQGTQLVADLVPGTGSAFPVGRLGAGDLTPSDGKLFFATGSGTLSTMVLMPAPDVAASWPYGDFDGVDDYASVALDPALDFTSGLTLMGWFKHSSAGGDNATGTEKRRSYRLLAKENDAVASTWMFDFWNAAGTFYRVETPAPAYNDLWHHLAATYDGQAMKLYLDGALVASRAAGGAVPTTDLPLEIGRRDGSKYYAGSIRDVQLYGQALTEDEIRFVRGPMGAQACFTATPLSTSRDVPLTVDFDASCTFFPFGEFLHYRTWDFGDGVVEEYGERAVTHTYTEPGTFTVKLQLEPEVDEGTFFSAIFTWTLEVLPSTNQLPTVTMTSPRSGSWFRQGDPIVLEANASDPDGEITNVAFFHESTRLGESTTPPYTLAWTGAPVGRYILTAVATDNSLGAARSDSVSVFVLPSSPPPLALQWVRSARSTGFDEHGNDVAVDGVGNVYVTGAFAGEADFDGDGLPDLSTTDAYYDQDLFLAKYDAGGNLLWVRSAGSEESYRGMSDRGMAVAVSEGSIYVAGVASGSMDFDADGTPELALTDVTGYQSFVARYDTDGQLLWVKPALSVLSTEDEQYDDGPMILGIDVDGAGHVYATGYFPGKADFDGDGVADLTSAGRVDVFVSKYNAGGELLWVRSAGGDDFDQGISLATGTGGVSVTGAFRNSADFDGDGVADVSSVGGDDIFVASYDADGNLRWVQQAGSPAFSEKGTGVAVSATGAVYVTGEIRGPGDFDDDGVADVAGGPYTMFLAKYDAGGGLSWVQAASELTVGSDVAVDAAGSANVTGQFLESPDFDGDGMPELFSVGSFDIFVAKYSADGTLLAVSGAGGAGGDEDPSIAVGSRGDVYLTGSTGNAHFDGDGIADVTSTGTRDVFVAKYTLESLEPPDETPPVLALQPQPLVLWPPNHKYQPVEVSRMVQRVTDDHDGEIPLVHVVIERVTSDEAEEARTGADIRLAPDCQTALVRAERQGSGNGRVYMVHLAVLDAAGNTGRAKYAVHVPKAPEQDAIDDGPAHAVEGCSPAATGLAENIQTSLVAEVPDALPTDFALEGNYPNPFNPQTTVRYALAEAAPVVLEVYDVLGRRVAMLVDAVQEAGRYEAVWDGRSEAGELVAGGVYVVRLKAGPFEAVRTMVLVK